MDRQLLEKNYWNVAACDPDVEAKFICNFNNADRLKVLGDLPGRVLEIGCGIGKLMKHGYYGIDISERMIQMAKNLQPGCNFYVCDGRTIPFDAGYFDVVYCVLVFQHIPFDGFKQYVSETARVLKPGGKFIFQFIEGDEAEPFSHHYNLEDVKHVLTSANLNILSIDKGLIHGSWTWVRSEKAENKD